MTKILYSLRFALVAGLLMLTGWLGTTEGFREFNDSTTSGQRVASVTQIIYGLSALVALYAVVRRVSWLKVPLAVWVVAVALTGGLASVVWGGEKWTTGVLGGAAAGAVAWLVAWAAIAHARSYGGRVESK